MPNRLADATSPYLLQHKDNPVDWWEWSDEAFREAEDRQVPVLLSVGYSACHWCHVMAHESFEDEETAAVMNERFVNIKVDREERPDVDSIYMEAVQAMTGRGGWPMTVWMTPDRRPFYAGTYFPKDSHQGMASFGQVMDAISEAWNTNREGVIGQAQQLVEAISGEIPSGDLPSRSVLGAAVKHIMHQFDPVHGGFGGAPKFPQQPVLEFLLRWRRIDDSVDAAIGTTLSRMADGGIHDHVGGGFARYSVDREWLVPHFEKMLYDNAQLARIYLWAGVELGEPRFLEVARSTIEYMLRDLRHDDGGFFSAEDADSEGVEGKFYVWDIDELEDALGSEATEAAAYFGATAAGNFEDRNILNLQGGAPAPENLGEIRAKLLERRDARVRPGLDDKVVASWNGLAIRVLAEAGAVLAEPRYTEAAVEAARFVLDDMVVNGSLMRAWREGRHSGRGFLDDYAGMALGLLAAFQATGQVDLFEGALSLIDALPSFESEPGRFYTTAGREGLIKRPRDLTDNPLPSGNAMAAEALLTCALLTGDAAMRDRGETALAAVGELAARYPSMVGHHLAVLASLSIGTKELAVVGPDRTDMLDVFWAAMRPEVALAHADGPTSEVPLLEDRPTVGGKATAYVCQGFVCDLPTTSPADLAEKLAAHS